MTGGRKEGRREEPTLFLPGGRKVEGKRPPFSYLERKEEGRQKGRASLVPTWRKEGRREEAAFVPTLSRGRKEGIREEAAFFLL